MEQDKESGYGTFNMVIEGEDGSYSATDDFYGYLLRPGYDEALTEKLAEQVETVFRDVNQYGAHTIFYSGNFG